MGSCHLNRILFREPPASGRGDFRGSAFTPPFSKGAAKSPIFHRAGGVCAGGPQEEERLEAVNVKECFFFFFFFFFLPGSSLGFSLLFPGFYLSIYLAIERCYP